MCAWKVFYNVALLFARPLNKPVKYMTIIEPGPLPSTIMIFPGVFTEFPVLQTGCSMVNLNITVFK